MSSNCYFQFKSKITGFKCLDFIIDLFSLMLKILILNDSGTISYLNSLKMTTIRQLNSVLDLFLSLGYFLLEMESYV